MQLRFCLFYAVLWCIAFCSFSSENGKTDIKVWQTSIPVTNVQDAISGARILDLQGNTLFISEANQDVWLIIKSTLNVPVVFSLSEPLGVAIDLYIFENNNIVSQYRAHSATSSNPHIIIHSPLTQSIVIKVRASSKANIEFAFVTPSQFLNSNNMQIAWNGLQAGFVTVIALMFLFIGVMKRTARAWYGAVYFCSLAIVLLVVSQIAALLIGEYIANIIKEYVSLSIVIGLFASLSYYRFVFKLTYFDSKLNGIVQSLRVILVTFVLLELWKGLPYTLLVISAIVCSFINLLMIYRLGKGSHSDTLVKYAWWIVVVGLCYWVITQLFNVMPVSTLVSVQLVTTLHVSLLCIALLLKERQRQKAITFYALHDSETGCPNKSFLYRNLKTLIINNKPHTLLLFRALVIEQTRINYGMEYAQKHLKLLTQKLNQQLSVLSKRVIEQGDVEPNYVYRMEDSVFAIVIEGKLELSMVEQYVCVLSSIFEEGVKYKGAQLVDQLDIGASNFPLHANSADQLIQRALQAMSIKTKSADRWHIFDIANSVMTERRLSISSALVDAIEHEQFELYFQPQVCLKTGSVYGAEALLRWCHPTLGQIPPDQFIPIAESSGLIHSLTEWVVEKGLECQKALIEVYPEHVISLNISGKDLARRELPVHLMTLITQLSLMPSKVTLEITESATIGNTNAIRGVFEDYRQIGVKMAIDDFGTGYSSLAYLTQLGFDELKIDKQFVMNMENIPSNQTICNATCDMAHSLGSTVVAEGVESQMAYSILKKYGCDIAQGYFIARPMTFNEYLVWLRDSQISVAEVSNLNH